MTLVCFRRAKALLSPLRVVQLLDDLQRWEGDLLADQLGNSVSLLHHKLSVCVIEHYDT